MSSQVEDYTKNVLKVVVAQVCQIIGWNSINQSSLEVLVDTLDRFMKELTKQTYRITELYQRTEPTLDDLALAFHYLNLNLTDIKEYIDYVGPPETNVPAIPKYPAAPPQILNIKRSADDAAADTSSSAYDSLQPTAEDSDDESQFLALFQYNREYKTEITGTDGTAVDVKKEDGVDIKPSTSMDGGGDSKQDMLRKLNNPSSRMPAKRKLVAVQLTATGRIQGIREGRMPGADLPAIFLSEIEAATHLENQGSNHPVVDHKGSKNRHNRYNQDTSSSMMSGHVGRSNTPSFPSTSASTAPMPSMSSKRDKLSQIEPDRVKANIFKKISQPHKHSPQQTFTPVVQPQAPVAAHAPVPTPHVPVPTPTHSVPQKQHQPPPPEVIDIDSSPNPPPVMSPGLQPHNPHGQQLTSSAKREKKQKKKEKAHREQQQPQFMGSSSVAPVLPSNIPQLPAGTTLEAIPMQVDTREEINTFPTSGSSFFPNVPNFSLPSGPGLIPMNIPPALAGLGNRLPGLFPQLSPKLQAEHSPKRKEAKEAKRQQQKQSFIPPNLFLPDTTVRVETVVKNEPPMKMEPRDLSPSKPTPVVVDTNTIDLLSDDDEVDSQKKTMDTGGALPVDKAAAKKAEKQKKKEQRRLEKLAAAQAASGGALGTDGDTPMNLSADGAVVDPGVVVKKEKQSKMERKMEKMLLKKMLKSKKGEGGEDGGPDQAIDLSMLDQEKQRKLEKKLKKLQKEDKKNKAKLKAQAAEEAASVDAAQVVKDKELAVEKELALQKSPEPLLLPKLTLKLNSPKVGSGSGGEQMLNSPKEAHSSKDYRPLTVDTGDVLMATPVKRVKAGSAQNSPLGGGGGGIGVLRQEPVEPELAKISPLVTRPMKQQQPPVHQPDMASPSSSGRGRPKGSTNKDRHGSSSIPPPVIPIKSEDGGGGGAGNQVWICPACGSVDDGSPMIGCDGCDNWYHWLCVGIHVAPESSSDWFCRVCIMQRKEMEAGGGLELADLAARKKEKKKRKKEKRAKMEAGSD